ncbi:hypothetical protein LMxysn_0217 [Listeria monocytogenes]|nr:hypothetical protein LMxysn_0217 [Listeria monocytogenes]
MQQKYTLEKNPPIEKSLFYASNIYRKILPYEHNNKKNQI